jgi:hypothetical protein
LYDPTQTTVPLMLPPSSCETATLVVKYWFVLIVLLAPLI